MDFLPESSRDCINVDSHENRGKNSNRGIDEIKPAEFVGSISKDLNDETKVGMEAVEEMTERMGKGECQKNYKWNPIFYKAENYEYKKQACSPPPKEAHLEIQSKGDVLVDSNKNWLVSQHTINKLKLESGCHQNIDGNYVLMNRLRIVQSDKVEHILKRIKVCPHEEETSDFCFSNGDRHWHYSIISTNILKSGKELVVPDCKSPTWHCHSTIEGAEIFLYKVAKSK